MKSIERLKEIERELGELEPHSFAKAMTTDRTRMEILNTEKRGILLALEDVRDTINIYTYKSESDIRLWNHSDSPHGLLLDIIKLLKQAEEFKQD